MVNKSLSKRFFFFSILKRKIYTDIRSDKQCSPCIFHEYLIAFKSYLARFPRIPFVRNQNSHLRSRILLWKSAITEVQYVIWIFGSDLKVKLTAAFFVLSWNRISRIKWLLRVLPESFKRRQSSLPLSLIC